MSERSMSESAPSPAPESLDPNQAHSAADTPVFSEPAYGNLPVPDLRDGSGSTHFGKSYGFPDPSPTFEPSSPAGDE